MWLKIPAIGYGIFGGKEHNHNYFAQFPNM